VYEAIRRVCIASCTRTCSGRGVPARVLALVYPHVYWPVMP
jgi:hypothetical protein